MPSTGCLDSNRACAHLKCFPDHNLLSRSIGGCQATGAAILVDSRPIEDASPSTCTATLTLSSHTLNMVETAGIDGSQHKGLAGLPPHIPISRPIHGLAASNR